MTGDDAEALWNLYAGAIGPLDDVAAMRHLVSHEEMLSVFAEPGITKLIGWEGSEPVGLGLITNQLELVPEASTAFLASRFPKHFERDAVFYGMAVLVKSSARGMTAFSRIYTEMWQIPAQVGGVIVFDMCQFNRDFFDGDQLVHNISSLFPHSSWQVLDQQTWYSAELPLPLAGSGVGRPTSSPSVDDDAVGLSDG